MTVESLLEHPPVMDFLRRATREQIARIPPELRGDMPRIVEVAKSHGVQISPLLAAYASTIQRNQRTRQILQPAQPLATQGASQ
jgi:hypothetical protein